MGDLCSTESRLKDYGFSTFLILVLLLALSGIGTESYLKANSQARMATRESQSREAIYVAEGGIEWAKAQLTINPDSVGQTIKVRDRSVEVTIEASNGGYWITSKVIVGHARREIRAYLKFEADRWITTSYHELHR